MTLETRKGASRTVDIPKVVLEGLHSGQLQSVNLTEWLAVDSQKLLEVVLPEFGLKNPQTVLEVALEVSSLGVMGRTERIAAALERAAVKLESLESHNSDTVRCWAAYIAVHRAKTLKLKLEAIRPYAIDTHFGVREIAWMAWRPNLIANLKAGLQLLKIWSESKDANARRFASEASRPRGVWCAHIQALKDNPELGLSVLEPLRSDGERYVQTSVANWLNDASKTRADWVKETCARWLAESDTPQTRWTVNHALRGVRKAG
jgi:3-methyladenine DNA glycosylase AlkC